MKKKLIWALFGLLFSVLPVFAAGTLPLALSQTVDQNGHPVSGALLYSYVVGTVSQPQLTYQDTGLTIVNPWPLTADQNGRIPMFYLADGSTHVRLTDSSGNVLYDNPAVLVIGPSSGGGSGSSVDPTSVLSSGDLKVKYGTGPLSGYVRANGLTMGNAVSGATERANSDTQNLWVYLCGADANLVVSGGRTGNCLNDYNSGKTITLPDWRGRAIAALGDMGNGATSIFTSTWAGCTPTTLGAACGSQNHTLVTAEMPAHNHGITITDPGHTHNFTLFNPVTNAGTGAGAFNGGSLGSETTAGSTTGITASSSNTGSGSAHSIVQPSMLATIYLKL